MRTLAITQNLTLDGSIEMLGDWFDPQGLAGVDNSDMVEENHAQDAGADALLVGRQTFTDFRGYWRDLEDDGTGVSRYLNEVAKYVVSETLDDPDWAGTTVLRGDWVEQVRALKAQEGQDIVTTGSIRLCHALIEAGLVDEYRLYLFPAAQGGGRRLFPEGFDAPHLHLVRTREFRSGVVLAVYRPEGRQTAA